MLLVGFILPWLFAIAFLFLFLLAVGVSYYGLALRHLCQEKMII